jgi:hypothetical protein
MIPTKSVRVLLCARRGSTRTDQAQGMSAASQGTASEGHAVSLGKGWPPRLS